MNTKFAILFVILFLTGCERTVVVDQCLRVKLAQQCLKDIPKGPSTTVSNDWDEAIEQCDRNSYQQSKRSKKFVSEECAIEEW